jgi:hypothetical protein
MPASFYLSVCLPLLLSHRGYVDVQHDGLDTFDLVRTDRWAEPESVDRNARVVVSEQACPADLLPGREKKAR